MHILRLEPARSYAVSSYSPGVGALVGTDRTAILGPEFPETTWRYEVDTARNVARTTSRDGKLAWEVPLAPFLGCVGVTPAMGEARSTIVPGVFGGNMDCPQVRAGNTVFLGVNVTGGMRSFGDGHDGMGDGEIMGAARPLEDAGRIAYKALAGWVRQASGLDKRRLPRARLAATSPTLWRALPPTLRANFPSHDQPPRLHHRPCPLRRACRRRAHRVAHRAPSPGSR